MKQTAEAYLGRVVNAAAFAVPSDFLDSQREALRDAAAQAGLRVLRIVNSYSAPALAYGLERHKSLIILVVRIGGRSFEVSLLQSDERVIERLGSTGGLDMAGNKIDSSLVAFCVRQIQEQHKTDVSADSNALSRLRNACERAKIALSRSSTATVHGDSIGRLERVCLTITRDLFDQLNEEQFRSTLRWVDYLLAETKVDKAKVDKIVLAGGSSHIPKLQQLLERPFWRERADANDRTRGSDRLWRGLRCCSLSASTPVPHRLASWTDRGESTAIYDKDDSL